jgi:hypothetical protein
LLQRNALQRTSQNAPDAFEPAAVTRTAERDCCNLLQPAATGLQRCTRSAALRVALHYV